MKLSSATVIAVTAAILGLTSAFVLPVPGSSSSAISRTHRCVFIWSVEVDWSNACPSLFGEKNPHDLSLPFLFSSNRSTTTTTFASGGSSEFNKNRAARKPGPLDLVVELQKPLGIVLEEDEKGNVYVKELSPAGNAARVRHILL